MELLLLLLELRLELLLPELLLLLPELVLPELLLLLPELLPELLLELLDPLLLLLLEPDLFASADMMSAIAIIARNSNFNKRIFLIRYYMN